MSADPGLPVVAIVGGSGKEGKGLAYRLARAGYPVVIGSRSAEKAQVAAKELEGLLSRPVIVRGSENLEAVRQATIAVITVPHDAHSAILEAIKPAMSGRLLIDATVPLQPGKPTRVRMPIEGSAAQAARGILGEGIEIAGGLSQHFA